MTQVDDFLSAGKKVGEDEREDVGRKKRKRRGRRGEEGRLVDFKKPGRGAVREEGEEDV